MLSLCFQNKSSSTNIAIDASLVEGPFFYFYVESVYLLPSILEANTCVNCVHWFLHVYLLHLLYYFVLTIIHEIYMLQVESNRWNFIFLCVASMPLLWIIALWVNSYARLIDACLESTIHEKSLLYDSFVYSCHLPLFWLLHSLHVLTIVWSRLWWHVTSEIIFVIVLPARDEQN